MNIISFILLASLRSLAFALSIVGALFGFVGRLIDTASRSLVQQSEKQPTCTSSISMLPSLPFALPINEASRGGDQAGTGAETKIKSHGKKKPEAPALSECFYVVPAAIPLSCVTAWGTDGDRKKVAEAKKNGGSIEMKLLYSLSRLLMPLTEEVQVGMSFDCGTRSIEMRTHIIAMEDLLAGKTVVTLDEREIDKLTHHMRMANGPEQDNKGFIHHPAGILKLSIFHKARRLETLTEANESGSQGSSSDSNLEEGDRDREDDLSPSRSDTKSKIEKKLSTINEETHDEADVGQDGGGSPAVTLPYPRQEQPALCPPSCGGAVFESKSDGGDSDSSSSLAGGEGLSTILHLIRGEAKGRKSLLRLLATINVLVLPMDAAMEFQKRYELTILDTKRLLGDGTSSALDQPAITPHVDPGRLEDPFSFLDPNTPRPRFTIVRTQHALPRRIRSRRSLDLAGDESRQETYLRSPSSSISRSLPCTVTVTDDNPLIPFDPDFDFQAFLTEEEARLAGEIEASRALPGILFESFDSVHARIFHQSVRSMGEDMRTLMVSSSRVLFEIGTKALEGKMNQEASSGALMKGCKSMDRVAKEKSARVFSPNLLSFLAHYEMWALWHLEMEWLYHSRTLVLEQEGRRMISPTPPHITSTLLAKSLCANAGMPIPPELRIDGAVVKGPPSKPARKKASHS